MIKLFWNTHNQKKPHSNNKKTRDKQEWDFKWGHYHKKSSDKWIYEILKKIKYNIIETESNLEKEDTLIIVDSSVEEKSELYSKPNIICSKNKKLYLPKNNYYFGITLQFGRQQNEPNSRLTLTTKKSDI